MKEMSHFLHCQSIYTHFGMTQFGAKYGPRGTPRAIYEPGGSGCHRDTYCIERVKVRLGWDHSKWKNIKNTVETMSFSQKMSCQISSSFGHHALNRFVLILSLWLK